MGTSQSSLDDNLQQIDETKEFKRVNEIRFHIQDTEHVLKTEEIAPNTSLNSYIRKDLHLTGTKAMCLEGGCGSCVVVLQKTDPSTHKNIFLAVNSCLVPILSCNEWRIYTIEGIGDPLVGYHPVQEVLAKFNGTQCGFCSSGMVMNMYALYESGKLSMQEVENSFSGNICRCTGYRPILSAFKSLCTDITPDILGQYADIEDLKLKSCQRKECSEKCAIKAIKEPFHHLLADSKWIKVYTLKDLLSTLNTYFGLNYRLVAGNTAKGVFTSYGANFDVYIDITSVPELTDKEVKDTSLILGASTTLANAIATFSQVAKDHQQFIYLKQIATHLDLVANVPVRNVGTIAGNLMIKHDYHDFPSDVFLSLEAVNAVLVVVKGNGDEVKLTPHDFINYDMKQCVLKNVVLPSYSTNVKYISYKIMPRAQNTHAIVNAAFLFKFDEENNCSSASIVFGNINKTFVHANETEKFLVSKNLFDNNVLQQAYKILENELDAEEIPPDPSPIFRKQLAIALFYKAVLSIAPPDKVLARNKSGGTILERPVSQGTQEYETKQSLYPLTQAIPKIEALAQTTGQAKYINDMPDIPHQLFGVLILSEAPPNSVIKNINAAKALLVKGIVAFYSKDDIPGDNNFTPNEFVFFKSQEEIFCSSRVQYYEQPLGILVGTSEQILEESSGLVEVVYDYPPTEPLLSVREILKAGKTDRIREIRTILPSKKGDDIKHVIKGSFDIHQQYHFHMETQCCNVIPTEDGLDIYPSSQWMDLVQLAVSNMLKIPNNKINVTVRRCGGAFGAKISRNSLVTCAAALAAWKLRKPVKLSLSLKANMAVMGKRWPLSTDYEVGVNDKGIIQYLNSKHYTDVGAVANEDGSDMLLRLFTDNYNSESFEIHVNQAITDTHTNTWTRAPGSTEGLACIEAIMDHIAYSINVDPLNLRVANFAKDTPLLKCVDDLKSWADLEKRIQDTVQFNKENRWKKKGISAVPMAYIVNVFGPYSVKVSIFHGDGSVQISHGGIEIGQGINTKVAQVCASKLGIPLNTIVVLPSNSFISANDTATGGSITSEAVCFGVMIACDQLLERIAPYRTQSAGASWEEVIKKCNADYVDLSAVGHLSPKTAPNVKPYFIYAICAAEVLLDVLTGQHQVTRVDLIEDTGQSMSPEIDIGQVEGAFIMGLGYYTTEKIVYSKNGKILTNNTWTYYPPGAKDIPIDFRVKFPKNGQNPQGVLNSKATAEPPLCMSVSVPLAIRNAVASARIDADPSNTKWFPFGGTTDVENIFVNSANDYTKYIL